MNHCVSRTTVADFYLYQFAWITLICDVEKI